MLVVEDEMIVARSLQKRLQGAGYQVPATAPSSKEALHQIRHRRPDLVLMDIMIDGDLDGIEAARRIRDDFGVPVIFLTAYADAATLERAKAARPYGYVLKPFYISELLTSIEIALHRHRFEQELDQQKRWFSAALRSIGDAVLATDPAGTIQFVNHAAQTMTGWADEDLNGRDFLAVLQLTDPEGEVDVAALWQDVRRKGGLELPPRIWLQPRAGDPFPVGISASAIRSVEGEIDGFIVVMRDLSLPHAHQQMLEQARRRAEQMAELKETLLHKMTHEIRTPLTSILGYASMITDERQPDQGRHQKFARVIQDSCEQLMETMDTVLEWTRLQSHPEHLVRVPMNVLDCARAVIEAMRPTAEQRGLTLELEARTPLPVIQSDYNCVYRILTHLLNNAIRYSTDGRVCLTLQHEARMVRLMVTHTGGGLRKEELDQMLQPFQWAANAQDRPPEAQELRLGLAIASELTRALGGALDVDSSQEAGSRFTLSLPIA